MLGASLTDGRDLASVASVAGWDDDWYFAVLAGEKSHLGRWLDEVVSRHGLRFS